MNFKMGALWYFLKILQAKFDRIFKCYYVQLLFSAQLSLFFKHNRVFLVYRGNNLSNDVFFVQIDPKLNL